ncbi:YdcF family protein [Roseomonas xinghualingensis]|uniref:YdcF family protein n=1 Tax=Roseomonas xinghualingensis TaxID=2986475 RepID=UPI0021F16BEB|nr:YdcF family protein [Roseomonas sp. SXEYE001]MCV4205867.1 YdcF family protein [Roseomonas sp. SXEYE001]
MSITRPALRRLPLLSVLMGLVVLAISGGFLWFLHQAAHPGPPGPEVPGIAVLTGGPDRVETGLLLLSARPGARLIVSGVGPASSLGEVAREVGIDPAPLAARVSIGRIATSTRGNAREIAAWVRETGIQEITVVTASFHMPRALLELRRSLPGVALHPHPVAPFVARPVAMLKEYAKLVGAALGLSVLTEQPRQIRS